MNQVFSFSGSSIFSSYQQCMRIPVAPFFDNFWWCQNFKFSSSSGVFFGISLWFSFSFSGWLIMLSILLYAYWPFVSFITGQMFCPIFYWGTCFLIIELYDSSYSLDPSSLSAIVASYFFPVSDLPFYLYFFFIFIFFCHPVANGVPGLAIRAEPQLLPTLHCGNTRSLTLFARPGIEPVSQRSRDTISLIVPQQEHLPFHFFSGVFWRTNVFKFW